MGINTFSTAINDGTATRCTLDAAHNRLDATHRSARRQIDRMALVTACHTAFYARGLPERVLKLLVQLKPDGLEVSLTAAGTIPPPPSRPPPAAGTIPPPPSRPPPAAGTIPPPPWRPRPGHDPEVHKTAAGTIPPPPSRPPPAAGTTPPPPSRPPPGHEREVHSRRMALCEAILQPGVQLNERKKMRLILPSSEEEWLAAVWNPTCREDKTMLGSLWVAVRPQFIQIGKDLREWPMHITIFRADLVRKPNDVIIWKMRKTCWEHFQKHNFVPAESPEEVLDPEVRGRGRRRVLIHLEVHQHLHNSLFSFRHTISQKVWYRAQRGVSRCTPSERHRFNFHLSLD